MLTTPKLVELFRYPSFTDDKLTCKSFFFESSIHLLKSINPLELEHFWLNRFFFIEINELACPEYFGFI